MGYRDVVARASPGMIILATSLWGESSCLLSQGTVPTAEALQGFSDTVQKAFVVMAWFSLVYRVLD